MPLVKQGWGGFGKKDNKKEEPDPSEQQQQQEKKPASSQESIEINVSTPATSQEAYSSNASLEGFQTGPADQPVSSPPTSGGGFGSGGFTTGKPSGWQSAQPKKREQASQANAVFNSCRSS